MRTQQDFPAQCVLRLVVRSVLSGKITDGSKRERKKIVRIASAILVLGRGESNERESLLLQQQKQQQRQQKA